jgi:hypothetical protein
MGGKNIHPYGQKNIKIPRHRIQTTINKFPQTEVYDRIAWQVRGIISKSSPQEQQLKTITNTFQTHLYNNINHDDTKEARIQLGKINNRWDKLKWILKSWWTAFEFFMVDCLQRNRFHFSKTKLFHTKASPHLDHIRKIDFLSTILRGTSDERKAITIGVQLTTEKSHIKQYPNHKEHMKKKKKIVNMLSEQIATTQDPYIKNLPEKLQPKLTSYMVVNGSINKRINIEDDNIFLDAFTKREEQWFIKWWPSQYLGIDVQKELWIIYHAYQKSLKHFIDFLEQQPQLPDEEIFAMHNHDNIYHLIATYNPDNKELQYKVFYNNQEWENKFLFYISYFLHENI